MTQFFLVVVISLKPIQNSHDITNLFVLQLPQRRYKIKKRGTAMPRSELEVLGKPLRTNVVIAAHAICVRTTMPPLCVIEKFPRFPIHKISITLLSNMSWRNFLCVSSLLYLYFVNTWSIVYIHLNVYVCLWTMWM